MRKSFNSLTSPQISLIEQYLPLVGSIISNRFHTDSNSIENDDMYSDGMLGLCEAVNSFDNTKSSFVNPATSRIIWKIQEGLRSRNGRFETSKKRIKMMSLDDHFDDTDTLKELLIKPKRESNIDIEAIFKHLSKREQEIIYFKYFANMVNSEIAEIFNLTESRIHQMIQKVFKRLRPIARKYVYN